MRPLPPLLLLLCGWLTVVGEAETVSVPPSADTCLFELDPTFNFGGQRDVVAGTLGSQVGATRSRALYKFDIAAVLPVGAEITSARFKIDVVRTPTGKRNSTFSLHRVLSDWGEGNKRGDNPGGAEAEAGESTWEARFHPDQPWSVPGGAFGTDFAQDASAERTILDNGAYVFEFNATGLDDLRYFASNADQNFGWMLATQLEEGEKTARRWASREHRNTPPVLELKFATAPAVTLPVITISGLPDSPAVQFSAETAAIYSVFKSPDLTEWKSLASIGPLESAQIIKVPDPQPGRRTFYRVSVVNSSQVN
jgi:hypothetical protein